MLTPCGTPDDMADGPPDFLGAFVFSRVTRTDSDFILNNLDTIRSLPTPPGHSHL